MPSTRNPGKTRTLCWPARDFSRLLENAVFLPRRPLAPISKSGVNEEDEKIRRTNLRYIGGNDRCHIDYCLCGYE